MTWLLNLKGKLALILGAALGFAILYINVLKNIALKKEIKQQKAVSKVKDKANKALVEGLENESKDTKRGYFNSDSN